MHKGPRAVRPTPGQRCAEWSQTDARTKLWVRRTKTWQTQLKRTSNRSVSWVCPNMQKQYPSAKGQQETQVFAWFSAAWSSSMPFSRWFAGVDTIPGKPLRTQELSTKHVHVSSYVFICFIMSIASVYSISCLQKNYMCHGTLGKLSLGQCTLSGLPYSAPASLMEWTFG